MIEVRESAIAGVWFLNFRPMSDSRGELLRVFCASELAPVLGSRKIVQINQSSTDSKGTIRGLHMQQEPFGEMKIIRCQTGSVYDVAVDMRPASRTLHKFVSTVLSPDAYNGIVISEGIAHGFQALEDGSVLSYLHTENYNNSSELGFRYNDPMFGIDWPLDPVNVSERDKAHRLLTQTEQNDGV